MLSAIRRINWKAVLYGFIWVISLTGLVALMSFIEVKKNNTVCKDVKVIIPGSHTFIERSEIDHILQNVSGPLVGRTLEQINIHRLESVLRANPFVEFAKVYADMNGTIQVQIRQREPLLRVINMASQDFYIDRNGMKVPMSQSFTARVLVANGNIFENFSGSVDTLKTVLARNLFKTALFIEEDTLWRDQIEQLFVNSRQEIELIPRVGNHRIILGNADSLQTKFTNLLVFYKKAMPEVGWETYKAINIKYTNQVIGVKNQVDSTGVPGAVRAPVLPADSIGKVKATKDSVIKI